MTKKLTILSLAFACATTCLAENAGAYADTTSGELGSGVDYMAYAEIPATVLTLWDGTNASTKTTVASTNAFRKSVGDRIWLTSSLTTTYDYNGGVALGTNFASGSVSMQILQLRKQYAIIVHNQVRSHFGFNPFEATKNGLVGYHTKQMDTQDKSLVKTYLSAVGFTTQATAKTLRDDGNDYDHDGIADGWELYVGRDPYWYDDRFEDLDQDGIELYQEYDGGNMPTNPDDAMTFGDNLRDDFAYRYHLKGDDAYADADGDGLPNYSEYLISEVFKFCKLDPDNAKTDMSRLDYFRKKGDLYYGEIFTDHDKVEYGWEMSHATAANAEAYDADRDDDADGWSNYAEFMAGTDPEYAKVPGGQETGDRSFPVPLIKARVVYNGNRIFDAPIVFRAWRWRNDVITNSSVVGTTGWGPYAMTTIPDGQWTASVESSESNTTTRSKYIGLNPGEQVSFHVGNRGVAVGTLRLRFRDVSFENAAIQDGVEANDTTEDTTSEDGYWYLFAQDYGNGVVYTSVSNTVPVQVGTVDYATGVVTIDFGCDALQGVVYERETTASGSTTVTTGSETTGKSASTIVNYDKFDLSRSYVRAEWSPLVVETSIDNTYFLTECDDDLTNLGHIREGKNQFVVFADLDGSGEYEPGEPFGYVKNVDIGWNGGRFSVELTETSTVMPRIDLFTGVNDRDYCMSGNGTVKQLTYTTNGTTTAYGTLLSNDVRKVWVSLVRYAVDGVQCAPNRVLFTTQLDLTVRSYLHEGDALRFVDAFDLDWDTLKKDGIEVNNTVTYAIVFNWNFEEVDGVFKIADLNKAFKYTFDRTFTMTESGIQPYGYLPGFVYGAKPTFKWTATKVVNSIFGDTDYTAFGLKILSGGSVVYDSGFRLAPPKDDAGRYVWTPDQPLGLRMPTSGNFTWQVKMYNAKIRSSGSSAASGSFVADLNNQQPMNDHGYSSIAATVKYAGPISVLSRVGSSSVKGKCIVQAFETADFSGVPMGATYVTDADILTNASIIVSNAVVRGLQQNGTYYIRAFIDSNGNGERDAFESWGAAASSVTISASDRTVPTVGVWIEDADTDGDWIPDAYEYAQAGWSGEWSDVMKQQSGAIIGGDQIVFSAVIGNAGVSTGAGGGSMTLFQNASVATGLAEMSGRSRFSTIRKTVANRINPNRVKVTAVTLSEDGGRVVLSLADETATSIAGETLGRFYNITDYSTSTAQVTVRVYRKETLASDGWVEVTPATTANVVKGSGSTVSVALNASVSFGTGYYKVEVVQ